MYSEEIKYDIPYSEDMSHLNKLRISYFENRSCLTNVLDFLDQEVVIIPGSYFSYDEGYLHIFEDCYIYPNMDDGYNDDYNDEYMEKRESIEDSVCNIDFADCFHLSVLNNHITIIAYDHRCIFTNRDMEEGNIIGTIIWVKNFNELLKKYSDRNLKRISKAIVCSTIKINRFGEELDCLDDEFFLSMDVYKPEIVFEYNIDSYMSNVCIDVYNKLAKIGLNGLVGKYIPSYKQCDGYGEKGKEEGYSTELCKCGGLRAFCYLDI